MKNKLKVHRAMHDLTQQQLADKLGHRLEVESKEGEYTRLIIDFSW